VEQYSTVIGIAVQTILFLLAGYGMVIRNDIGNTNLKEEIASMKEELKKLAEVITMQAVQTTRINGLTEQVTSIEKRVEDLRRGNGFVQRQVDREY
jgi:replicative DNA helicase